MIFKYHHYRYAVVVFLSIILVYTILFSDNIYFTVRVANSSGLTVSQTSVSASQPARVAVSDLDLGNHSVSIATINSHLRLSSDDVTVLVLVTQAGRRTR